MKDIVIVFTAREAFGLMRGGVRKQGRRKAFGAFGLSDKVHKAIQETLTVEEYETLKAEWLKLEKEMPDVTLSKPKPPKKTAPKQGSNGGYIVKDF